MSTTCNARSDLDALEEEIVNKFRHDDHLLWTEMVPDPLGTPSRLEKGILPRRQIDASAQEYLAAARRSLIEIIRNEANSEEWQQRNWNAFRRLLKIQSGIDLEEVCESLQEENQLSRPGSNMENYSELSAKEVPGMDVEQGDSTGASDKVDFEGQHKQTTQDKQVSNVSLVQSRIQQQLLNLFADSAQKDNGETFDEHSKRAREALELLRREEG
ncbi:hypothetical protein LTR64_008555 [Lithohypha guttulata]|uniref:Uncharacterized protein n=1 Tax=Lithohypha guttulata TaxID=1690604 RepID=A0AAN7Y9R6_9EURO|nr:hypothetical protein LTR51_001679 [Lithohypha guttulata]KAK5090582.1 hypothetical protein LTR05_000756 [Lithohypha guttulata]